MRKFIVALVLLSVTALFVSLRATAQPCEQLAQFALPHAHVTSAQMVAAGAFAAPSSDDDPSFFKQLPPFCRVTLNATPSADSDIKVEVWMPAAAWNGKFRGQGNGGFAGDVDYHSLGLAVLQGYASAATDTGHSGQPVDASWALGHPEKVIDFGYRAIHEMTTIGKATTKAFYGDAPKHSYFASCSNGGRQALMEAQRFPEDYDGIIAGAPANYWTHLVSSALWDAQATTLDPASYIPSGKLPAIAQGVLSACDARDGVKDGIVGDPPQCRFEPATMLCKNGDADSCLTQPQITALKKLYQGAHDSKGKQIFPGFVPGGEEGPGGWGLWITGPAPGKGLLFAFNYGFFANMVYEKADWDYKSAKLDDAVAAADKKLARVLNATDANLKPFTARGGKLILFHGWSDAAISPLNSIDYYESVVHTVGQQSADSSLRLYMVPGMQHCAGGPGTDVFGQYAIATANDPRHNMSLALEDWVENGTPPPTVIASKLNGQGPAAKVNLSRPLCAFPQTARYKGAGDTTDAANFACQKQ